MKTTMTIKTRVLVMGLMVGGAMIAPGSLFAQDAAVKRRLAAAEASIDAEKIRAHVKYLADDKLEVRGPGLKGAEMAAEYIAKEFGQYGLKPAGDNGTYLQQINFVGMKAIPAKTTMSLLPKHSAGI